MTRGIFCLEKSGTHCSFCLKEIDAHCFCLEESDAQCSFRLEEWHAVFFLFGRERRAVFFSFKRE